MPTDPSHSQSSRMTLADAAAEVLRNADSALTPHEIAERAIDSAFISPRSNQPWTYIAAAIRKDNRRRVSQGESPRFESEQGRFRLA